MRLTAPPQPCQQTQRVKRIRTRSCLLQHQLKEPLGIVEATTNGISNSPRMVVKRASHGYGYACVEASKLVMNDA